MSAKLEEFNITTALPENICPICQNSGWEQLWRVNGRPAVRRCPQESHLTERLIALGTPPRFQDCTLASFAPQTLAARHARQHLLRYLQNYPSQDRGLLIQGEDSNNKTHLVVGMMRLMLSESLAQPRYSDASTLLRQLDVDLDLLDSITRRQQLESIINCEMLILDNLNSGGDSDNQRAMLEYIVSYRYRQLLPIVITTNLSLHELQNQVGLNTCSRLIEMCEIVSL